jgi:hypothetical protein
MSRTTTAGLARRAGRAYEQIKGRLTSSVYRSQLGPTREGDLREYLPNRAWHNQRGT